MQKLLLASVTCLVSAFSAAAAPLDHWTTNQLTTNWFGLNHVVSANGRFVAIGDYSDGAAVFTSEDGFQWTLRYTNLDAWGATLSYANGRFAGASYFGEVLWSMNGIDWNSPFPAPLWSLDEEVYRPPFGHEIVFTGSVICAAVGSTNGVGAILTGRYGTNWVSRPISPGPGGCISGVASGNGTWVAIGRNDGFVYRNGPPVSEAGTWIRSSIAGGSRVFFVNGLFIVPLNERTNLLSTDAANWAAKSTGITNLVGKVSYVKGLFMARAGEYLATSQDGTNWVQYPQRLPGKPLVSDAADWSDNVASDGTRVVVVEGYGPQAPYSYNAYVYTSDPLVEIHPASTSAASVAISGLVGQKVQIQSAETLGASAKWGTNATIQLTTGTMVWSDPDPAPSARFYRATVSP